MLWFWCETLNHEGHWHKSHQSFWDQIFRHWIGPCFKNSFKQWNFCNVPWYNVADSSEEHCQRHIRMVGVIFQRVVTIIVTAVRISDIRAFYRRHTSFINYRFKLSATEMTVVEYVRRQMAVVFQKPVMAIVTTVIVWNIRAFYRRNTSFINHKIEINVSEMPVLQYLRRQ